MPDRSKEKDQDIPPGAPDRTPVREPGREKPPLGDPKPGKKKKKLSNHSRT